MSLTRVSYLHNMEVHLCDGRLSHRLVEHTTQNYIKCYEFPTQRLKTFVNIQLITELHPRLMCKSFHFKEKLTIIVL
jgi:hypothetical protein